MNNGIVVVLTALNLEHAAVAALLTDTRPQSCKGTRFEVGRLRGTDCRIALAVVGKGNQAAGIITERAIEEFSPVAVMFVGVAGARRRSIALGDVVVATHVYAYHGATSEDDGAKARPRTWEASHGADQIARHVDRERAWLSRLPDDAIAPSVRFGPIAAGEVLHNSSTSYEAEWIREHYNDALAVEMEAAGAAHAAHLNGTTAVVIRGISDRADGTKQDSDRGGWQPRAAANAAAFAVCVAEELIAERQANMSESASIPSITNIAHGTVGIQAAHVSGSTVWIGTGSSTTEINISVELDRLRGQLVHARTAGELDDDTHDAAQAEVRDATAALADGTGGRRALLALKRLRGLVGDVADLGTRVAALIAAVKSMS
jgi:8-oxo-dGTP diphosphatase